MFKRKPSSSRSRDIGMSPPKDWEVVFPWVWVLLRRDGRFYFIRTWKRLVPTRETMGIDHNFLYEKGLKEKMPVGWRLKLLDPQYSSLWIHVRIKTRSVGGSRVRLFLLTISEVVTEGGDRSGNREFQKGSVDTSLWVGIDLRLESRRKWLCQSHFHYPLMTVDFPFPVWGYSANGSSPGDSERCVPCCRSMSPHFLLEGSFFSYISY